MGASEIMDIGRQGLGANRQALQVTTNNIANANTPGYSRQRAIMVERPTYFNQGVLLGGGVDVPGIIRIHDDFIEKQLVDESRLLGGAKARFEGAKRLESLLHSDGFQIPEALDKFFNSARELSVNPESPAGRALLLENTKTVARSFHLASESLEGMRRDVDLRLGQLITDVNVKAKELAELNQRIGGFVNNGQEPSELLDQRDQVVRALAEKLGYPTIDDERGHINFLSNAMGTLVVGGDANQLIALRTGEAGAKESGSVDLYIKDPFGLHRVTQTFEEGEIGGLITVRDKFINNTLDRLDNAAYQFGKSVNEIHNGGYGLDGSHDRALFNHLETPKAAARNIEVSKEILDNPDYLAVAGGSGAPGDNRNMLDMADLQNKFTMPSDGILNEEKDPRYTFNESLNSLLGEVGSRVAGEDAAARHQESIVNQLENYRQNTSGVSLEEEAVKMMQYQAVFNASAKTMKMGDELLQTILNLKS